MVEAQTFGSTPGGVATAYSGGGGAATWVFSSYCWKASLLHVLGRTLPVFWLLFEANSMKIQHVFLKYLCLQFTQVFCKFFSAHLPLQFTIYAHTWVPSVRPKLNEKGCIICIICSAYAHVVDILAILGRASTNRKCILTWTFSNSSASEGQVLQINTFPSF